MTDPYDDWNKRILCSDGNCIGVIGPDGRCKECGLAYDGELPVGIEAREMPAAEDSPAEVAPDDAGGDGMDDDQPAGADDPVDNWEDRTLCIDEGCIGVVGPDGRCKECGKPYPTINHHD